MEEVVCVGLRVGQARELDLFVVLNLAVFEALDVGVLAIGADEYDRASVAAYGTVAERDARAQASVGVGGGDEDADAVKAHDGVVAQADSVAGLQRRVKRIGA